MYVIVICISSKIFALSDSFFFDPMTFGNTDALFVAALVLHHNVFLLPLTRPCHSIHRHLCTTPTRRRIWTHITCVANRQPYPPRRKSKRRNTASDIPCSVATLTLVIPSVPPIFALRSFYVIISGSTADKGAISPRAFIDSLRDGDEHFRGVVHGYLLDEIFDKYYKHQDTDKTILFPTIPAGAVSFRHAS